MTEPDVSSEQPGYALSDRLVRAASTESETASDETLVLDRDSGRSFNLGAVGGFIWSCFDGERDLAAIAAAVSERFEVTVEEAGEDLLDFAAMLSERGLVEIVADG